MRRLAYRCAISPFFEPMQTRRDFLHSAALLTSGAFVRGSIPDAIARALAINPAAGTTFLDAEHVVILMQENRSFDHSYGTLRGVRGFNDPRAHTQPNGNPVWVQTDAKGDTYAPFRLDINSTNATWMGGLPHTWPDQVDARNGGRYDKWLIAKPQTRPAVDARPLHARRHSVLLRVRRRVHGVRSGLLLVAHRHDAESAAPVDRTISRATRERRRARDERRHGLRPRGELDDLPGTSRRRRRLVEDLSERDEHRHRA